MLCLRKKLPRGIHAFIDSAGLEAPSSQSVVVAYVLRLDVERLKEHQRAKHTQRGASEKEEDDECNDLPVPRNAMSAFQCSPAR